jgi:hypothetical protein
MKTRIVLLAAVLFLFAEFRHAMAQGTVFTYQGQLTDGGLPANGTNYGMVFYVYDAPSNGTQLGNFGIASLAVSNGLFTVPLDFGTNVFTGPPRWLEITVQKNGGGFTTLSPRQQLTPAPYAIFAGQANGVTAGSITAASIAPGSITSNLLTAGAVNNSSLQSPYQSGRINVESFTPPAYFASTTVVQSVAFSPSFAAAPVVTTSLETSLNNAAATVPPLLTSAKTTSGFNLSFTLQDIVVSAATNAATYFFSGFPLASVNGRPAIAFNGPSLRFSRALDALGERWGSNTMVALQSAHFDLQVINGNPALAFIGNNSLMYVRAGDSNGTTWPSAITVKTTVPGTFVAQYVSLATISGNPAIACWNSVSNGIFYFRAGDSSGAIWSSNGVLVATGNADLQLAQVSGNPAIAYAWDNGTAFNDVGHQTEARFIRANDTNGTSWPASPITVNSGGTEETISKVRLLPNVASNPAIAFLHNFQVISSVLYDVRFDRATNAQGSIWPPAGNIFSPLGSASSLNATLIAGKPAVSWFDSYGVWRYAESSNNGTNFSNYLIPGQGTTPGALADIGGKPAVTMLTGGTVLGVGYLRDTTPIPDTFINWIAIQP